MELSHETVTIRLFRLRSKPLAEPGMSYGTAVAATYGNMFHQRVGKMVINGALGINKLGLTTFMKVAHDIPRFCAEARIAKRGSE